MWTGNYETLEPTAAQGGPVSVYVERCPGLNLQASWFRTVTGRLLLTGQFIISRLFACLLSTGRVLPSEALDREFDYPMAPVLLRCLP